MSRACATALRSITSRPRASASGAAVPLRSMRAQPKTALSGVRSSCDSVARNSSFSRFAASAWARAARSLSRSTRSRLAASSKAWATSATSSIVVAGDGPGG